MAWDAPDHYGVACKRTEIRDGERSAFNSRRTMPGALAQVVRDVRARILVLSYNDESWIGLDELVEMCAVRGHVEVLAVRLQPVRGRPDRHPQSRRGAGRDRSGRLRNLEYVLVAGERARGASSWSSPGATRLAVTGRADRECRTRSRPSL